MASPRTRRLILDHEKLQTRFAAWPRIKIISSDGHPPDLYRISYALKGLFVDARGAILERHLHVLEMKLSLEYPRRAPLCRMMTPVFHPNFDDASVCIGDFWAASEWLDDLVIRIGRMITYQQYNIRSPLNGLAARWAAEHPDLLPVDDQNVAPPEPEAVPPALTSLAPASTFLTNQALTSPALMSSAKTWPASKTVPENHNPWANRIIIRSV